MSVSLDKVKIIMGKLVSCYPKDVSEGELQKKVGNSIDTELVYCKEKEWITETVLKGQWQATAKGVDAFINDGG